MRSLLDTTLPNGKRLIVRAELIGIKAGELTGVSRSLHTSSLVPSELSIIRGRTILNSDIRSGTAVAVIDSFTERLLFGTGEGLGKKITMNSAIGIVGQAGTGRTFAADVVGIAEDDYYAEELPGSFRSAYNSSENQIYIDVRIYVPSSLLDETVCTPLYVFRFNDSESCIAAQDLVWDLNLQYRYYGSYLVTSRRSLLDEMEESTLFIRMIILLIMGLVLALSVISILSILFFSTKERFTEIGVRKAFGASNAEITIQFVIEAAVLGLFSSAAAFLFAYAFAGIFHQLIAERLSVYFHLRFRLLYPPATMAEGTLLAAVSSLIPAFAVSSVQVVKAMRLD